LSNGSFHFFVWASSQKTLQRDEKEKEDPDGSDLSSQDLYVDHKLVGECHLGVNKILFAESDAEPKSI